MPTLEVEIEVVCSCGAVLEEESAVRTERRAMHHPRSMMQICAGPCCACIERTKEEVVRHTELLIERTKTTFSINTEVLKEAIDALERHIPEGHGAHPNPEYEIVENLRKVLADA